MSLLTDSFEACRFMNKSTVPDGLGGFISAYVEGADFECSIVKDSSSEMRVAEAQGVKAVYTVTTPKALSFSYHDVFKRMRDNKIFRVTSDGNDSATPKSSRLNIRQVTAEEWEIPENE